MVLEACNCGLFASGTFALVDSGEISHMDAQAGDTQGSFFNLCIVLLHSQYS